MSSPVRYPGTVSIYEAIRNRPEARARLNEAGITRDHMDYRLGDAARLLGVPVERLTALIDTGDSNN